MRRRTCAARHWKRSRSWVSVCPPHSILSCKKCPDQIRLPRCGSGRPELCSCCMEYTLGHSDYRSSISPLRSWGNDAFPAQCARVESIFLLWEIFVKSLVYGCDNFCKYFLFLLYEQRILTF